MYHQLHCLRALNLAFGLSRNIAPPHVQHCLNYLRQAALCGADLTLERGDFTKRDFDQPQAQGETHTCRDWTVVYAAMKDNWGKWLLARNTSEFASKRDNDGPISPPMGELPPFLPPTSHLTPLSKSRAHSSFSPVPRNTSSFTPFGSKTWLLPTPLDRVQIMMDSSVHYPYKGPTADAVWESTLPPGGGLLHFPSDPSTPYSISLFHQLRCLNIIRKDLIQRTYLNATTLVTEPPSKLTHHCMNYIRLMLLCQSDTRLQSCRRGRGQQISVPYVTHGTCNDWEPVYAAAEENWREWNRFEGQ